MTRHHSISAFRFLLSALLVLLSAFAVCAAALTAVRTYQYYPPGSLGKTLAIHTVNVWAGLDTNSADNQLRYVSLTNFPRWPY